MALECTRNIVFVTNLQEVPVFAAIICVDSVFSVYLMLTYKAPQHALGHRARNSILRVTHYSYDPQWVN